MKNKLLPRGLALAACVPLLATARAVKIQPQKATPPLTCRSAFADHEPRNDAAPAMPMPAGQPKKRGEP